MDDGRRQDWLAFQISYVTVELHLWSSISIAPCLTFYIQNLYLNFNMMSGGATQTANFFFGDGAAAKVLVGDGYDYG
jgi:hypothetical protein